MTPKVAFVLTVYNKEAWIAQTLNSILDQTMKDIEIIVWDDGSTDNSTKIVEHYAKQDRRIIIGGTKVNQGIAKAYNCAQRLITAPYTCIASADDLYDRLRAQRTWDYFEKHQEKYILYGNFWRVEADGTTIIEHKICPPYNKEALFEPNNQYIPHGFMSVQTKIFPEVPYDEKLKYGIDYPWIKALANKYPEFRFKHIKADFGFYRWFQTNVSHQHRAEIVAQGNA